MKHIEIKFRGIARNGEWAYGDLITTPIHHECVILQNGCISFPVRPETVGQFTVLKDKNGKEIYEGDIIHNGDFIPLIVGFNKEMAAFGGCSDESMQTDKMYWFNNDILINRDQWEIIGNIHETVSKQLT